MEPEYDEDPEPIRKSSSGQSWHLHYYLAAALAVLTMGCASAAPAHSSIAVLGPLTYSNRVRIGESLTLTITLYNPGPTTPTSTDLALTSQLFDGFILSNSSPPLIKEDSGQGYRWMHFPSVTAGGNRTYTLNLVAKTAGEYPWTWHVSADSQSIADFEGRTVVFP